MNVDSRESKEILVLLDRLEFLEERDLPVNLAKKVLKVILVRQVTLDPLEQLEDLGYLGNKELLEPKEIKEKWENQEIEEEMANQV